MAIRPAMIDSGKSERFFFEEPWRAAREAERCLGCFDAPCMAACPTHINVPQFIGRIRTGNMEGAYETLVAANALPAICGLVCPTEQLCEGSCVVSQLEGRPVHIGALQYHVCHAAQTDVAPAASEGPSARVAVVGSGPAGLACAITLRRLGHAVDLFDRHGRAGGLVNYSIPNYRLPDSAVQAELARLDEAGIGLHLDTEIDGPALERMMGDYDAVFLGIGLSDGTAFDVAGVQLDGVWSALDYLDAIRQAARSEGPAPALRGRVVVIGGGNVAVDAATVAATEGADEVILLYRRTVHEMPAWEEEYNDAAQAGVQFRWLTAVTGILGQEGRVTGVQMQQMELTAPDESGRRGVRPSGADASVLPCDHVIVAIGQALQSATIEGVDVELSAVGVVKVDAETWQTSRSGLFAGGDAMRGGRYVVQAVADGTQAAYAIDQYVTQEVAR